MLGSLKRQRKRQGHGLDEIADTDGHETKAPSIEAALARFPHQLHLICPITKSRPASHSTKFAQPHSRTKGVAL